MDSAAWFGKVKKVKAFRLSKREKDAEANEPSLKNEPRDDIERFFASVVALFVDAMDRFKPAWRFREQIADSCQEVGQNGAEGSCKKSPESGGCKKGR